MSKCSLVLDFLCYPIKLIINKCCSKANPYVKENNSNKIVIEEIDNQLDTNSHLDTESKKEIREIREIFIDKIIPESELNQPKQIPKLNLKNLVKKDSLNEFINNNYLNSDLNTTSNYGSNSDNEIQVNTD